MSLFLGNLSSHTKVDELERVFRRFGWCSVQLKDGYGFAIYEVPEHAERALRSLQGKRICGENIAIDWSKRQPRPLQSFSRDRRPYEAHHGRNFHEKVDPQYHGNFRPSFGRRGRRFEEMDYNHEEEKDLDAKGGVLNEGENDEPQERPANDLPGRNSAEPKAGFEHYEAPIGIEKRAESDNSPKAQRDKQLDHLRPQPVCFTCGEVGHKWHNCSRGRRSRRDRVGRFQRIGDDADLPRRNGNFGSHSADGQEFQSEKLTRLKRREDSPEGSEDYLPRERKDSSRVRKRGRHESKKHKKRRSRIRSRSSSPHSGSAAGRSRSRALSSQSVSRSRSRSSSRSSSYRRRRKRRSDLKSKPKSKTRSRTRSLSIAVDAPHASEEDNFPAYSEVSADDIKEEEKEEQQQQDQMVASADGNIPKYNAEQMHERERCLDGPLNKISYSDDTEEEISVRSNDIKFTKMSFKEMCATLGHYGLPVPEEKREKGSSVGTSFGAARMWPWEMVYYRRLKKGLITTENYARRQAQNDKFGIVDKFIRSSSGWGEAERA